MSSVKNITLKISKMKSRLLILLMILIQETKCLFCTYFTYSTNNNSYNTFSTYCSDYCCVTTSSYPDKNEVCCSYDKAIELQNKNIIWL